MPLSSRSPLRFALLPLLLVGCASSPARPDRLAAPSQVLVPAAPVPGFADGARRAKLAAAFPAIDARLRAGLAHGGSPGLAVGIVIDGELAWAKGYGVRDVASGALVEPGTVFRIYSVTKTITAMAVLQLRDAGRLSLEDPAEKYLPELASLRYPTSDSPRITIRDLLSHEAGLPHFSPSRPSDEARGITEAELLAGLHDMPLVRAPGVDYQYSSVGFAALGAIVARVSGVPYRDYVAERILRPLGMTSTTFDPARIAPARLAIGYNDAKVPDAPAPFGADAPEGGLFSTIEDLGRYAAFQLSAWPPRSDADTGPLRRGSVREMHRATGTRGFGVRRTAAGGVRAWSDAVGLSWALMDTCDLERVITHNGGDAGYHSAVYLLPEYGVGVVTLANGAGADDGPARDVLAELVKSGGLVKRTLPPSEATTVARDRVSALLAHWDDARGREALGFRAMTSPRTTFEALHRDHGACHPEGPIETRSPGHASWRMACERGTIQFDGELMTARPGFDGLDVMESSPPSARMVAGEAAVIGLLGHWSDEAASATFATPEAAAAFAKTAARTGPCEAQYMDDGNGRTEGWFMMACGGKRFELEVKLDEASGRVQGAEAREQSKCPSAL